MSVPTLPSGWHWTTVRDLTSVCRRGRAPSYDGGKTPIINQKCVRRETEVDLTFIKYTNEAAKPLPDWSVLQTGDILVNATGSGTLGRVGWLRELDHRVTADTHVTIVRPQPTLVRSAFLGYYLHSLQPVFEEMSTGSTNQRELSPADIAAVRVPLPSLAEQDAVVAITEQLLSDAQTGSAYLQSARERSEVFEKSCYAAALRGELTPAVTNEEGAEHLLDALAVKPLPTSAASTDWPSHWRVATLGDLASRVTSGSRDWKPYYNIGTGVFVLTQSVRMRALDFSKSINVNPPPNDAARERSSIAKDDLLVTIVGANVGNAARVTQELSDHFVCQSLALVRPKLPRMARFLELYLTAPSGGQAYFERCFYGQGRPHLSFPDIKKMPVPVPPPAEQDLIVAAFGRQAGAHDSLERSLRVAQDEAGTLRRAILYSAFIGALTPRARANGATSDIAPANNSRAVLDSE